MGEHLRVDRQEVLTNSDDRTRGQSLASLPQVADGIDIGGSWHEIHRSLASRSQVPGRGHAEHGSDSETDSMDYLPDQSGAVAPLRDDVGDNAPDYTDLMLDADPIQDGIQRPVLVSVVPAPKLNVVKSTRILTIFDGQRASYTGTFGSAPDLVNAVALAADPNRTRMTVQLFRPYSAFAGQTIMYWFAMSTDPQFNDYTVIQISSALQTPQTVVTLDNCTNPFYFTILPVIAYDPTKTNVAGLSVYLESAYVANANPAV